jgi:hypothetical protein
MNRFLALLCGLLAVLGLPGCDRFNIEALRPGVSTAFEVRDRLGAPDREWPNQDGSVTWEYSRQPEGTRCYMITIGPDRVVSAVEQVLNETGFARIKTGMTGDEVRRVLGRPALRERFELKRETVWSWRIEPEPAMTDRLFFSVHFDAEGHVLRTSRNVDYRGG